MKISLPLSIIIPVRNDGINLKMMLKILHSTVEVDHELLIVADTSADDSRAVVEDLQNRHPGLRWVLNSLGPGVGQAVRAGINEGTVAKCRMI